MPKQGDVWQTAFAEGFERPGIVASRNELNLGRLVLVVPCTSSRVPERRMHANNVFLPAGTGGLTEPTVAQVHLIQPVEINLLLWRRGELTDEELSDVLRALAWAVELFPE